MDETTLINHSDAVRPIGSLTGRCIAAHAEKLVYGTERP
jgi:hypothetical protein